MRGIVHCLDSDNDNRRDNLEKGVQASLDNCKSADSDRNVFSDFRDLVENTLLITGGSLSE